MATRKQKAKVGFFLVICGVIIAGGILVLSGYKQEPRVHYWIEFEESVLGLGNGSIVEYQGVPVGNVENIYVTEKNKAHVDFFVFTQKVTLRNGVRGQLVTYSLATGTLSVSLSGGEGAQLPPGVEIPATRSLVKAVSSTIEDTLGRIDKILTSIQSAMQDMGEGDLTTLVQDADGLLKRGQEFMENANNVVVDLKGKAQDGIDQFKEIAQHIDALVTDTNATVNSVKKKVDAFALNQTQDNLNKVMDNVSDLSKQLKQTADSIDKLSKTALRETGNLEFGLRETLRMLNESLGSARDLLNYLQQDPASLLRGKGKPQGEK